MGWMQSLRSKENMRQRDNAKGMDGEFWKQGDYATTRQCGGDGWGVSEARRLKRQRDNAKVMDAEVEKQGDYATTRQCEGDGWGVFEARRLCDNATMRRG